LTTWNFHGQEKPFPGDSTAVVVHLPERIGDVTGNTFSERLTE